MTIDGKELLEIRPDFADEPDLMANRIASLVDLSPARRLAGYTGQKPVHVLNHKFVLRGSEIAQFEAFFNARAGKWEDFLAPSWTSELGVSETNVTDSPSGAPDLYIDWCDYATHYGPTDGRLGRYLFILWDDGTFFATKVTDVAASTPNVVDQLTLEDDLPQAVEVANPPMIGFVYNVRFASDELFMEYRGPSNAVTDAGMLEVVISTPETDVT